MTDTNTTVTYTIYEAKAGTEWSGIFKTEREARYWASTRTNVTIRRIERLADGSEIVTAI